MLGLLSVEDIDGWKTEVQKRVGTALHPTHFDTLLIILPGASGDVAISTSIIHYFKHINPKCHITYATKKANIPIAQMCPGVDETIELPNEPINSLSRRRYLNQFVGFADAVIYPSCVPEDMDLLKRYNLIETLWLLSGLENGVPQEPQKVWIKADANAKNALAIVNESLAQRDGYMQMAVQKFSLVIKKGIHTHTFRRMGVRNCLREALFLLRHRTESASLHHMRRLKAGNFGKDFVILSTQANSVAGPPHGVTKALIQALRHDGRTVLHNVLDPCQAALGTVPLKCSYAEFLTLRQAGIPFVGWRSGLCDIAAAAPAPMCVLYPAEYEWSDEPITTFGFKAMNIVANCYEFVCRGVDDVTRSRFVAQLHKG